MVFWILLSLGFVITVFLTAVFWDDGGFATFFGCVLVLCGAPVAIEFMVGAAGANHDVVTSSTVTHHVVSLQDNFGTTGHINGGGGFLFFSISGSFNGHLTYSWYERNPDGSYQSHSVRERNNVKVFQVPPSQKPRVVETIQDVEQDADSWLLPPALNKLDEHTNKSWALYVPRGTIVHDYKLDAK